MPSIPPHIFRAYDIRGIAGKEVSEELCSLVGKAFGTELRERYNKDHPIVIVGRDARTHSPELEEALIDGLVSAGCAVKLIGEVPSPVNYFAVCHFGCDGSIQVTASHNAKEDNGLKLQLRNAEAFSGEELQTLQKRIEGGKFLEGKGSMEEVDAVTPYKEKIESLVLRHAEPFDRTQDKLRESAEADERSRSMLRQAQHRLTKEKATQNARGASTSSVASLSPACRTGRDAPDSAQHDVSKPLRGLKVVADFGNGVAWPVYGSILKELGVELIELYAKPDGTFPNHMADPSKHETLKDLIETVKKENADLGIAFDGDGDRVGVVDEQGNVVSPDYLLLLLAEDHLSRHPGASIIYTVSMSSILETEVNRMGGKPIMSIVGHSFVEHAMKEHGSHLGAEQSGHFFCGEDFYDHDDALVAALRLLSILSSSLSSHPCSSLLSHYPTIYQTPEWRPHCDDKKKSDVIRKVTQHFQKEGYPCITIDGVRIDFGDSAWAGIRQSNTSPKISVCMEARDLTKLREMEKIVRGHLAIYSEIDSQE